MHLFTFLLVIIASITHSPITTADNQFQKLHQQLIDLDNNTFNENTTDKERFKLFTEFFKKNYKASVPQNLNTLTSDELVELFKIVNTINIYSAQPQEARELLKIIKELKLKGYKKLKPLFLMTEEALINSRLFGELKDFQEKNQPFEFQYQHINFDSTKQHTPNLLKVNGTTLVKEPYYRKTGIIVVSHPLCGFSQNARDYITNNQKLLKVFESNSHWIIPTSGNLYLNAVSNANKYETMPYSYAFKTLEWPEIENWSTPSFYFYVDDELTYHFSGWPKEGNIEQLKAGLKSIGLSEQY